mgnify:CR=1 FL=1|tara:strand:- start:1109 stop:1468 length:360 start_codon:yes stop_codon:yes gene_type:complete
MIDIDKYKGHTPAPWESEEWDEGFILGRTSERHKNSHPVVAVVGDGWWGDMMPECNANLRLITDAPLLLAEVKRLREDIVSILGAIDLPDYDEFPLTQEELRNMMTKYGQEHLICEGEE